MSEKKDKDKDKDLEEDKVNSEGREDALGQEKINKSLQFKQPKNHGGFGQQGGGFNKGGKGFAPKNVAQASGRKR